MGGGSGGPQAVVFVRPLVILAVGLAAGVAAWWVLMHEPPGGFTRVGSAIERPIADEPASQDAQLARRPPSDVGLADR